MKSRTKNTAAKQPPPEWLTQTPAICYELLAANWDHGSPSQDIELTRDEYEALKLHLAKLRGFDVQEAA